MEALPLNDIPAEPTFQLIFFFSQKAFTFYAVEFLLRTAEPLRGYAFFEDGLETDAIGAAR
jgi:hypothetical protein